MRVTESRIVYENPWMRLREDRLELPDGSPGLYAVVEKAPSAVVVPLDGDHVWLVEQWRHPLGMRCREFPQGAADAEPGLDAETVARNELAEETGLRAGSMRKLGRGFFAPGISSQPFDVWLATDLRPGERALEHTEQGLRAERVAITAFEALIDAGEIVDAATLAAWHLAQRA